MWWIIPQIYKYQKRSNINLSYSSMSSNESQNGMNSSFYRDNKNVMMIYNIYEAPNPFEIKCSRCTIIVQKMKSHKKYLLCMLRNSKSRIEQTQMKKTINYMPNHTDTFLDYRDVSPRLFPHQLPWSDQSFRDTSEHFAVCFPYSCTSKNIQCDCHFTSIMMILTSKQARYPWLTRMGPESRMIRCGCSLAS